jgi:phosphatidylinositol alpha-1,6-mannosyltransferase
VTQLLLTYDFPPIGGGIARMMGEFATRYPPGTLVVSTGRQPGSGDVDARFRNPVDRIAVPSSRLRTLHGLLVWSRRAAELARTVHPEFVWCGNFKPAGYAARWVRRRFGIPYGIIFYGTDLLLLQRQIRRSATKRRIARVLIPSAAVLVAISNWTRNLCLSVLDQLGLNSSEMDVRTLPLGTDPEHFRPGIDTSAVRKRYGLDGRRWMLSVARLTRHKGIDMGLRVLARLRDRYPDLAYAVVGSGNYLLVLETMARSLDIADRVRFLTNVPDRDLPGLYNSAEIYLGLSRQTEGNVEGFGISLVEAAACGIPAVAGRSGGIPETVRQGQTGLLVDAEQLNEICSTVGSLLDDRALAVRLGVEGRRAVETYYNWDRVAADIARIGHELGRSTLLEATRQ